MKIFAIGDLHMSTAVNKPMNLFGENWENHEEKIFSSWNELVTDDDIVFIVGDISWASKLDDAKKDLDKIANLKGKKYFIKGNHDYWWTTATGLNKLYDNNMVFMNTNYVVINDYAVCGTRGWLIPNDIKFDEKDKEIYIREAHRLRLSMENAKNDGYEKIIVLMHYPPTNRDLDNTLFFDAIKEYPVEHVVYGHLHGKDSFDYGFKGKYKDTEYHLVSCDYLDFKLKEIMTLNDAFQNRDNVKNEYVVNGKVNDKEANSLNKGSMTICIDIDGTMIDPYFFVPYLNRLNGVDIKNDDYKSINWIDIYGDKFQSLYRDFDTIFSYVYKEAKILPDVYKTIKYFEKSGHNVYYVTARSKKIDQITKEWIAKNGLDPEKVISMGSKDKVNIAKKLGCDVFIEDDPGNVKKLLDAGFNVIILDTNYNKSIVGKNLIRLDSWKYMRESVDIINKMIHVIK